MTGRGSRLAGAGRCSRTTAPISRLEFSHQRGIDDPIQLGARPSIPVFTTGEINFDMDASYIITTQRYFDAMAQ